MTEKGRRIRDVKAEKSAKRRRARRRKRVVVLLLELLLLTVLLAISYSLIKYGKIQLNDFHFGDILVNEGIRQDGYTTVALFGGDSREGELEAGTHADTIVIASIDNETKEVKLVSVYRDLMVCQEDGTIKKANNAYFRGGPQEAINMLNQNFDLDIENYVAVDFKALADTIDLIGGIEVDVTEAEAAELNRYVKETAGVVGKDAVEITSGTQTLDGVQAVTYARIRKNVGGDYARTDRQRVVIGKVAEKLKDTKISTIKDIVDQIFPQISTSFRMKDMIKLAAGAKKYEIGESKGFPFEHTDGRVEGIGSVVIPLGHVENVEELHAFLYPEDEYIVSEQVREIALKIEQLSGYTREDLK